MKEFLSNIVNILPEDISIEDFLETMYLKLRINKALEEIENNKVYTSEQLKKELLQ